MSMNKTCYTMQQVFFFVFRSLFKIHSMILCTRAVFFLFSYRFNVFIPIAAFSLASMVTRLCQNKKSFLHKENTKSCRGENEFSMSSKY